MFSQRGRWGKTSVQTTSNPFLENIDKWIRNDGSQQLTPAFHNPHRKGRPSSSVVALILEHLVGVTSKAASSGREKVWIYIQKTLEYLECGYQVSPKSLPLQVMKSQPLQSLLVGEVTNASHQPCNYSLNSLQMGDIYHEVWRTGWHVIFEVGTHQGLV